MDYRGKLEAKFCLHIEVKNNIGVTMEVSYKKLWKILIDRDMTKTDLRLLSGISSSSLAKLGKGENVTTTILLKICLALDCDISEIMTFKANGDVKNGKFKNNNE